MNHIRLAINGFGRIGRAALKIALERPDITVVAINDLTDPVHNAHLLKYDSAYGRYQKEVFAESGEAPSLVIEGKKIRWIAEKDPTKLPWKELNVDVVLECTGRFTKDGAASAHITAGARRVVVSAPTKGGGVKTYLRGVNDAEYTTEQIVSNASCTTNCVSPVTWVIEKEFGIIKAAMTTIHAVTAEQNLIDSAPPQLHPDLRRARSALVNMVPTSTGAATAVAEVLPQLSGKFDGIAIRVPIVVGSLSDFTFLVRKKTTTEDVIAAFEKAAKLPQFQGVMEVTHEPIVSSDIIQNPHSAIVDLSCTKVIDGDLVKMLAWYDNEWGYSNRLVEMAVRVGSY